MKKYLPCESDLLWLLFIQQQERIRTWKTEDLATANNEEKSLGGGCFTASFPHPGQPLSHQVWLRLQNPAQAAITQPREMAQQG